MTIKRRSENFLPHLLLAAIGTVVIVGCSSDGEERPEYLGANSLTALEIPPKLTRPNTQGALKLPEPSKKIHSDSNKMGQDEVIAPIFEGIELKNESRLYWLEIDESVSDVWKKVPQFLASEGIEVDRVEKLLGFVDTAWMNEYTVTYNQQEESSSWFSRFSPDYKDRFRIRIEAIPGENKTRLFVSHRGLQISVSGDNNEWVQRDSEPFLEREIMYRYALYSGIRKSNATELLASYHGYQPRVNPIDDNAHELNVKGEAATVWHRLLIAMDRLGVDIINSDKESSTILVKVGNLKVQENPHEDESGWFSGLFSGKDIQVDDNNDEFEDSSEYKVQPEKVAPEDHITLMLTQKLGKYSSTIKISNEDGTDISGHLALIFRDALLKQLK